MDEYALEVDARWEGTTGDSYNLIFEVSDDYGFYYLFQVNSDYQGYALYYRSPAGWTEIIPPTSTMAVNAGQASNHLKVIYQATGITLEVNGVTLVTLGNVPSEAPGRVGVAVMAYEGEPGADARFDNFRLARLPSTPAATASPGSADERNSITGEAPAWSPWLVLRDGLEGIHH